MSYTVRGYQPGDEVLEIELDRRIVRDWAWDLRKRPNLPSMRKKSDNPRADVRRFLKNEQGGGICGRHNPLRVRLNWFRVCGRGFSMAVFEARGGRET